MTFNVAKCSAYARGLFLLLLLSLFLTGCTGGRQAAAKAAESAEAPADSLKALFSLTIYSPDGKTQDLDAVLFSVPNKRYRMELTGTLGIGVASLLWLEEGWQMVFPTEKMYVKGAGYMVGLLNDPSLPLVHIHQVAGLFDGKVLPEKFEVKATRDSIGADSVAMKIVDARESSGRHFTYAEKNGEVQWLEMPGRDGGTEKIIIEEYKEFKGIKTPSKISFVRDSTTFLKLRVKKVNRGKSFGSGTWRLNIPRSYKQI
ncbi:MAG: hypothetical protein IJM92_15540 [Fibrobacter sp.]|uniref:hypothetical protein n=1 Tax=Fibrobacter sp. TaxID=35828 RepID=UPI0025BACB55|nr:hypothetical protein [Fibrobacter sp.]MBQ7081035.1 hypothetical protein [Fibrobacter sp.]